MNNVHLSKSKFCRAKQCNKILWMEKYKADEGVPTARETVLENGNKVGELAKGLFGIFENVEFNKNLNVMIDDTKRLMENKPNVITEASFNYDNNFCSVDILKNDEDGVEIYEVKSSTEIKSVYLDDVSYQYYILSNLGMNVKKACIVFLNNEYILHEELEIEKLFNIEDVTDIAVSKQDEIRNIIDNVNDFMEKYDEEHEPEIKLGIQCGEPYLCEFWQYCTRNLPKPNVFDVAGMWKNKKFEKYDAGVISFKDLQQEKLNPKYLEQINYELNNNNPKIEIEPIKALLNSLKYPLYFLDFETLQLAIPEYEGTKPYQQLPFQYSLHIIKENKADIEHREFLADVDDKDFIRHFAESLVKDISEDGSIIIYNNSFEPARINELARMYPDLADNITRINNNIVDFMPIFRKRYYYMKEMQGSYSIKAVLPALYPNEKKLDYHNLQVVHNGEEAPAVFMSLRGKSKQEQKKLREALLKYCELDTYAMVKIWEKLKEVTKD